MRGHGSLGFYHGDHCCEVASLYKNEVSRLNFITLTGEFDLNTHAINAGVMHFLNSGLGGCGVFVVNEGIATLERELGDGTEFLELVFEIIRLDIVTQSADVDL